MTFAAGQPARDAALIRKFGESVRYTAPGESTIEITAVFDNPSRTAALGPRGMAAQDPTVLCLVSEVGQLRKGDMFQIAGVDYRVKHPHKSADEGDVTSAALEEIIE